MSILGRIKERTEPWVSNENLQSIKDKDKTFQLYKNDKSDEKYSNFKKFGNKTDSDLQCKVESENHDSKSLWRSLKDIHSDYWNVL